MKNINKIKIKIKLIIDIIFPLPLILTPENITPRKINNIAERFVILPINENLKNIKKMTIITKIKLKNPNLE